jgi:hypothetical protein
MPSQARLGYNLPNIISTSSQARMGHITMTHHIMVRHINVHHIKVHHIEVRHIEDLPVEDHLAVGLLATESPLATTSSI